MRWSPPRPCWPISCRVNRPFHNVRTRSELEAAVQAAEAARALAEAELARSEAQVDFATAEYERAERLHERGHISQASLDRAHMQLRTEAAATLTARAALSMREFELDTARASLIGPTVAGGDDEQSAGCCYAVRAPVDGRILRIFHESEGVVEAGAPLIEIGDPGDLEIVVDLLSTDAVQVSEEAEAFIEGWGGGERLAGRVRRVEPYGFTKTSALGIDEQRVNVIVDFDEPAGTPAPARPRLPGRGGDRRVARRGRAESAGWRPVPHRRRLGPVRRGRGPRGAAPHRDRPHERHRGGGAGRAGGGRDRGPAPLGTASPTGSP